MLAATREQLEIPGFAYAEVERRVCDVHARHPINGLLLCLIDTRIVEAARLAAGCGCATRIGKRYSARDKFDRPAAAFRPPESPSRRSRWPQPLRSCSQRWIASAYLSSSSQPMAMGLRTSSPSVRLLTSIRSSAHSPS